jgi:hypothetical protein
MPRGAGAADEINDSSRRALQVQKASLAAFRPIVRRPGEKMRLGDLRSRMGDLVPVGLRPPSLRPRIGNTRRQPADDPLRIPPEPVQTNPAGSPFRLLIGPKLDYSASNHGRMGRPSGTFWQVIPMEEPAENGNPAGMDVSARPGEADATSRPSMSDPLELPEPGPPAIPAAEMAGEPDSVDSFAAGEAGFNRIATDDDDVQPPGTDDADAMPDEIASVETAPALDPGQALLASVAAYREAERLRADQAVYLVREQAERDVAAAQVEAEQSRLAAVAAEEAVRQARSDAEDVVIQLSLALKQVRNYSVLVDSLRQEGEALTMAAGAARKEADQLKEELAAERSRAANAERVVVELRSELESLPRTQTGGGVPTLTMAAAVGEVGVQGTAIFPVQVTAVVDCRSTHATDGTERGGIGVVYDVRMVAAIPQEAGAEGQWVELAVDLARTMFPTAHLSVILSDDCGASATRPHHAEIAFVTAPADDARCKAARVLAIAAGHLRRDGDQG